MMIRTSLRQSTRHLNRSTRLLSTSARAMAEGDTGSYKGGQQQDAWSNREKANEDMAVRQRERQKLEELKKKLAKQREEINNLEKDIDAITQEQDTKGSK